MKKILDSYIQEIIDKTEGYFISFERNPEDSRFELTIALESKWHFESTENIECEIISESDEGKLAKVYGKNDYVVIDDLFRFLTKIISINREIEKREKLIQDKMEEVKKKAEEEVFQHKSKLEEFKKTSFKDLDVEKENPDNEVEEDSESNNTLKDIEKDEVLTEKINE